MKLEKGRISSLQLTFLLISFIQGSLFVTAFTYADSPRDEWLLILIAYAIFLPFMLLYVKLSGRFPGDDLFQIQDKVYGRVLGKAISFLYLLLFIILAALNIRFPIAFMQSAFMTETPMLAFDIVFIILCALAVRDGLEALARISSFVTAVTLVSMVIYFLLLLDKFELPHFLPILDMPPLEIVKDLDTFFCIYLGEIFVFAMLLPYVSDKENIKRSYLYGTAVAIFTLLIAVIMTTSVLGNVSSTSVWPLIETSRQVEILNINARIEFLLMGVIILTAFIKDSILYYICLLAFERLFGLRPLQNFVVAVGLFLGTITLQITENLVTNFASAVNTWPFTIYFMLFLLPLATLITAAVRKLPESKGGDG